ncbi:MAG TPA: TolC family protein [Chitinophaga sp.]|uniref:TolC family protein n=1 Tax=Chitinophaga sp. TaxID=1869181 RepID=UPI002B834021|nr:TolC family protein [Chitinophaga sp.]HVI45623.1 TolC family protein [Chitinophaga sp.]
MKMKYMLILLMLYSAASQAQDTLSFPTYLQQVGKNNLSYAAEKYNLDIAAANVMMAKVFPDPELSVGIFNNGQRRMKLGYGFNSGLGYTLELGGKRRARIDLARSEQQLARYQLDEYFRNLRADATLAFLQVMHHQQLYEMKLNAWRYMQELAKADSIRFRTGMITETDARQSNIEAGMLLNETYGTAADLKAAQVQLNQLQGRFRSDTLPAINGDFRKFERSFSLPELVINGQNARADLLTAMQQKDVNRKNLRLAKASRIIDLGVNAGINNVSVVTNVVAPTPSMNTVSAGISIPLKFSNRNRGELLAAEANIRQGDMSYRQTELQVQTEITQAYFNYLGAKQQLVQFDTGLLSNAYKVLEGRMYSYKRGETSLLEVLTARRTYNDVQQQYYESLYNQAAALVELERAAAVWDIEF